MSIKRHLNNLLPAALVATILLAAPDAGARRRTNNANKPAAAASFGSFSSSSTDDEKAQPAGSAEAQRIADEEAAAEAAEKKAKTSIGQPLSQRIRAVTSQSFLHDKRFMVGPKIGTTINDPFYASLAVGLNAGYYVSEHLYLGLSGEFLPVNGPTNLVKVVGRTGDRAKYYAPMYFAYFDVNWVPFYGKISMMAEAVLHYDFYLVGGLGIAGMRSKDENVDYPPLSFSGEVGLGMHLFIKRWCALRIEITDRISYGARYIADIPGKEETSLQNIIGLTVGADFFFPTGNK